MTTAQVPVSFTLPGGECHRGEMPAGAVVHLALERLLPAALRTGHRLSVRRGESLIYPDMFLHEIIAHYGDADFQVEARPLDLETARPFRNYGVDHLALAMTDRAAARRFFSEGLGLEVVRDDAHLTVVTSGATALFLFDHDPDAPLSPPDASQIHHLGFVVDDLEAAAAHLKRTFPDMLGRATLLERMERLSLYGHVTLGNQRFLIQLSEIKTGFRGLQTEVARESGSVLYDYASRSYGVRLG